MAALQVTRKTRKEHEDSSSERNLNSSALLLKDAHINQAEVIART